MFRACLLLKLCQTRWWFQTFYYLIIFHPFWTSIFFRWVVQTPTSRGWSTLLGTACLPPQPRLPRSYPPVVPGRNKFGSLEQAMNGTLKMPSQHDGNMLFWQISLWSVARGASHPSQSILEVVDGFVVWRAAHFLTPDRPGRSLEDGESGFLMTDDDAANNNGGGDGWWMMMDMDENGAILGFYESLVGESWRTKAKNDSRFRVLWWGRCVDGHGYPVGLMPEKGTKIHASYLEKVSDMLLPILNHWKRHNCCKYRDGGHSFMAKKPSQWRRIDVIILLGT